jgi:hypothetical protein
MMRVETISGILYFGDVFFGTEFIRVIPNRILTYDKEQNGYLELENIPAEVFIPIVRLEAVVDLPPPELSTPEPIVTTEEIIEDEPIEAKELSFEEERQ